MSTNTNSLINWLEAIWRDTDGYVYVSYRTKEEVWKYTYAEWPRQKQQISDFILRQAAQGSEVYYSPSLWKEKSTRKESFLGSWTLWADFDGNAPEDWTGVISPDAVEGGSAAHSEPALPVPEPSARIQSSTELNQHAYWFLDELLTDADTLENLNRTIALDLDADKSVWNVGRVLRPPETTNYGYTKPDRTESYPVLVEQLKDTKFPVEAFKTTKDFRPLVRERLGDIPAIAEVLAKQTWSDELWEGFHTEPQYKGRSDQMMFVAYSCAELGFSPEQIYSVLINCDDRWGKYKTRSDRAQKLTDIVDRAITKYPSSLVNLTPEGFMGKVPGGSEDVSIKTVYGLEEFMATEVKINWMFDNYLSEGGYGIIAGQPGLGKSQLSLRLAEAVAKGTSFLGINITGPPRKVLFLSLEMSMFEVQEFLRTMSNYGEDFKDNIFISPIGDTIPLDRPEGKKFFENLLNEVKPDLVIIDSLAKSMLGSFVSDDVVLPYNQYLSKVRQQYGCAIVSIHHNRKSQDKRFIANELDDLYGSRFLPQDAQFVFMLYKDKKVPGSLMLNFAKVRFAATPEPYTLEHTSDLNFGLVSTGDNDDISSGGLSNLFGGGRLTGK